MDEIAARAARRYFERLHRRQVDHGECAALVVADEQEIGQGRAGQTECQPVRIVLAGEHDADGLAFGLPGTALANLLFVSHNQGGALTMVDLASMQSLEVATGGTRGDFVHVAPDGRLFITQSIEVDVLSPLTPPHVAAVVPVPGAMIVPAVNTAAVTFDSDMLVSATDLHSVLNPNNYTITNL